MASAPGTVTRVPPASAAPVATTSTATPPVRRVESKPIGLNIRNDYSSIVADVERMIELYKKCVEDTKATEKQKTQITNSFSRIVSNPDLPSAVRIALQIFAYEIRLPLRRLPEVELIRQELLTILAPLNEKIEPPALPLLTVDPATQKQSYQLYMEGIGMMLLDLLLPGECEQYRPSIKQCVETYGFTNPGKITEIEESAIKSVLLQVKFFLDQLAQALPKINVFDTEVKKAINDEERVMYELNLIRVKVGLPIFKSKGDSKETDEAFSEVLNRFLCSLVKWLNQDKLNEQLEQILGLIGKPVTPELIAHLKLILSKPIDPAVLLLLKVLSVKITEKISQFIEKGGVFVLIERFLKDDLNLKPLIEGQPLEQIKISGKDEIARIFGNLIMEIISAFNSLIKPKENKTIVDYSVSAALTIVDFFRGPDAPPLSEGFAKNQVTTLITEIEKNPQSYGELILKILSRLKGSPNRVNLFHILSNLLWHKDGNKWTPTFDETPEHSPSKILEDLKSKIISGYKKELGKKSAAEKKAAQTEGSIETTIKEILELFFNLVQHKKFIYTLLTDILNGISDVLDPKVIKTSESKPSPAPEPAERVVVKEPVAAPAATTTTSAKR